MSPSKNVPCYNGFSEVLEDLRFDNLFKEESGVSGSFRDRNGKEINKRFIEIDKESMDSDYEMFWSSLSSDYEMFRSSLSSDYEMFWSSLSSREQGNVKRKRNSKSDSKGLKVKVPVSLDRVSRKTGIETTKFVKNSSEIRVERSGDRVRDITSEDLKMVAEYGSIFCKSSLDRVSRKTGIETTKFVKNSSEIRVERSGDRVRDITSEDLEMVAEYGSIFCKSNGQPSANINSDSGVDESFKDFLASLSKCGENPEVFLEKSDRNMHQKDDESSSDLKILSLDDINEGDYTPFVPATLLPNTSRSQFREKLMALVRTPYDHNEYVDLWRKITERKSGQGGRRHECRKIYSTKRKENSRLDWHPKLRMKIDEFRSDPCKVLYLLRGFFFWLESTVHEGAFVPWLDSLYLKSLGLDTGDLICWTEDH